MKEGDVKDISFPMYRMVVEKGRVSIEEIWCKRIKKDVFRLL